MKPILFKTEMVRALQDDRKTVTRRVVKPKYRDSVFEMFRGDLCESSPYKPPIDNGDGTTTRFVRQFVPCKPPYRPGDILYVRETWGLYHQEPGFYVYKADKHDETEFDGFKWRPSIHMPREAARIFLRVTDVRVERLQDITVEDILAEGVDVEMPPICKQSIDPNFPTDKQRDQWEKMPDAQREEYVTNRARHTYIGWCDYANRLFRAFDAFWSSLIKEVDRTLYGWDANPWVWVIEFERCEKPQE